jgi:acyl carrier protein
MNRDEVMTAVVAAIREQTGNPTLEITDVTTADDVPGWDSLAHVRIVLSIGVKLGVRVSMDATYAAPNIGALTDLALAAVQAKGAA